MHSAIKGLVLSLILRAPCAAAADPPPFSIAYGPTPRAPRTQADRLPRTFLGKLTQARPLFAVAARRSENTGAPAAFTVQDLRPLREPLAPFATYVSRVHRDLLLFQAISIGLNPLLRSGRSHIGAPKFGATSTTQTDDLLELYRQRDRLIFFRDLPLSGAHLISGVGVFMAAVLLSAHAPRPLRILFDRPFHLGPAIFDRSGIGIGFGGRFP